MEHQVIAGYDDAGFFSAQPWGAEPKFTPERLSFGTWKEFDEEVHVNFYTIDEVESSDRQTAILASLDYAVDMHQNPAEHGTEAYGVGPLAYDNWIAAVPAWGSGHGNWWNATVWSECRRMAGAYLSEIGEENVDVADLCSQLSNEYRTIAENLRRASDKTMDSEEKIRLLKETKQLEAAAIEGVEKLAAALRVSRKP